MRRVSASEADVLNAFHILADTNEMRLVASLSVAVLLLSACARLAAEPAPPSRQPTDVETAEAPRATTTSAPSSTTTSTTRSPAPALNEVDLVNYVATIEEMLAGTEYEGQALAAPDVFLATGGLFCDQLDAGRTSDEVLIDYLETLTGGSVDEASDDDLTMAGAVLGSGLVTMCPHHIVNFGATE